MFRSTTFTLTSANQWMDNFNWSYYITLLLNFPEPFWTQMATVKLCKVTRMKGMVISWKYEQDSHDWLLLCYVRLMQGTAQNTSGYPFEFTILMNIYLASFRYFCLNNYCARDLRQNSVQLLISFCETETLRAQLKMLGLGHYVKPRLDSYQHSDQR